MTKDLQRYIKDDIDARTFQEIWKTLPENVRIDLRDEIIKQTGVKRNTVHYWATGHNKPGCMGSRKLVCQSIKKITGIQAHAYTLFPN